MQTFFNCLKDLQVELFFAVLSLFENCCFLFNKRILKAEPNMGLLKDRIRSLILYWRFGLGRFLDINRIPKTNKKLGIPIYFRTRRLGSNISNAALILERYSTFFFCKGQKRIERRRRVLKTIKIR